MILNQDNSLLLIIDIQEKLLNAVFNKEELEKKARILKNASSVLNLPVFITEQYPQGLGATISGLSESALVYEKVSFNALENSDLSEAIKKTDKKQVIVLGIETHICVHQTVSALLLDGYEVTVATDACGSRTDKEYLSALSCMKTNGASLKTTEMILFELLKSAKHPNFKEIQALIK